MGNISSLDQMNLQLNFNNINAEEIQTAETINCVFVMDVSPSVNDYIDDLNNAFNDFIQTMQQSHVHDQMLVSIVEFNQSVSVRTGFQPITAIPVIKFVPSGMRTALYDAALIGIRNAVEYRESLEKSGINVKTLVFIITDGEDNASHDFDGSEVKKQITSILKNESSAFSFSTILFGVGNAANFERAKENMGVQALAKVGNTGKEIRKMINIISSSISSSSNGQNPISNITF